MSRNIATPPLYIKQRATFQPSMFMLGWDARPDRLAVGDSALQLVTIAAAGRDLRS